MGVKKKFSGKRLGGEEKEVVKSKILNNRINIPNAKNIKGLVSFYEFAIRMKKYYHVPPSKRMHATKTAGS